MTVDATNSWNPTLLQLVKDALISVRAVDAGEDPTPDDYSVAITRLNAWIKEQEASGLHVWAEEEGIVFTQPGQYRYLLGPGSADHACDAWSWKLLTLTANAAAAAGAVTVASTAGVSNGDNVGVVLANGATFWTTVNGAPGPTGVTLAAPLPSPASSGAYGFTYAPSAAMGRPLRLAPMNGGRAYTFAGLNENLMTELARDQYMMLPNKTNPGQINQWFYAPKLVLGELYLWSAPSDSSQAFRCTWYRSLADWLIPGNTADFPQEWMSTLQWNLALELMPTYPVPPSQAQKIEMMALAKLANVQGWDRESQPIQFGMDYTGR